MGSDRPTKISDPLARGEGGTVPVRGKRARVSLPKDKHSTGTGISCVRGTDLFRDLSASEIEEIEGMTAMRTSRRGRVFFAPGQTGEVLFILKRGRVNVYRVTPDGKKLVTASLEPGTVFGEMSLIGQGMYDSFAEAAEDCTLCVMSRADVEHLLKTKPAVALRAMEIMARRLREAEDRLEGAAFKSVPARLALMLLRLRPGGSGELVGVSHQDLADMVGTYRETVTRVLDEFQAQGLVELGRKRIRVLQPDRLAALAEE